MVGWLAGAALADERSAGEVRQRPADATPEELLRAFAGENPRISDVANSPGFRQIELRRPECVPALIAGLRQKELQGPAVVALHWLLKKHADELWAEDYRGPIVGGLLAVAKETDYEPNVCAALGQFPTLPEAADIVPMLVKKLELGAIGGSHWIEPRALVVQRIGPAALPAIFQSRDQEGRLTNQACDALAALGPGAKPAVPELIATLHYAGKHHDRGSSSVRHVAAALGAMGPGAAAAVPALLEALSDRGNSVDAELIWALGAIGPDARDAVPALIKMLEKQTASSAPRSARGPFMRSLPATLGKVGPDAKAAVPALLAILEDAKDLDEYVVACDAVVALGRIGPGAKAAAPRLQWMLTGGKVPKTHYYYRELAESLWQITGDAELPVRELARQEYGVRSIQDNELATEVLGRIGTPAVPVLIGRLDDKESDLKVAAAKALGAIRPLSGEMIEALTRHAAGGEFRARRGCIEALAQMGPAARTALPALQRIVIKDRGLSLAAAKAIWEISRDADQATPCLIEAIEHGADAVDNRGSYIKSPEHIAAELEWLRSRRQCEATKLLGRIGPRARAALPVLEKESEDADAEIRIAARDAIRRIGQDAPKPSR